MVTKWGGTVKDWQKAMAFARKEFREQRPHYSLGAYRIAREFQLDMAREAREREEGE